MKRQGKNGFSLIELMVALAVAAILLVAAGPSFRDALRRNKVSAASNALMADIAYARSEAINRGNIVSICPSSDQATCISSGKAYESGWLIYSYQPGKGVVTTAYSATSGAILLRASNARDSVSIQALDSVILSFGSQGQVRRTDNKQPKFATCFRAANDTGTGTSTVSVPGAQLTVNASGSTTSQSLGVQTTCVPS
ncbi:GspH/FimT family pseudopilin [Dyella sp. LX-66]|uniref:GspH/FimT family pseudopilin n=1 Tax=unclassified Dyella TaxID=2634549 RepID=UPI001BE009A4|nr:MULTISPECIES: GspH/FimT family pseudopilin [unclassified Dyella]MBT2119100.1 GspH/FimT family pseudopilin [Dyella sp. LX-1]MBT2140436.1 GspH/FimT family pseudopilin [Dyella sp. LX-66]